MKKIHNPNGTPAVYSDGIEVCGPMRTLYVAGQVGIRPDGTIPAGVAEQTRQLFANLQAVLSSAQMGLGDIVKLTVFMIEPSDYPEFSRARSEIMGAHKPASTLVHIKQLVRPELLVEVEAVACAP